MDISNGVNSDKSLKPRGGKRILRWLCTGLILAFCLWLVFFLTAPALCQIALAQIAELTNTKIETKSVDFNLDGSVFIEKLVIRPHKQQKYDDAILKAETVYARFSKGSLLLLRPRLKEISLNKFVFDTQYDLDTGRWNIAALKIKAPEGGSGQMPLIRLEKGTLKYSKVSNGRVKAVAAVPVDARFGPAEKTQDGYSFSVTTAKMAGGFGKSNLTGFWRPGKVTIVGGISSADIPAFERAWAINVLAAELNYDRSSTYSLKLRIKDLLSAHRPAGDTFVLVRPSFLEKSGPFTALQRFFNRYHPAGRVDIDLQASGNLQQLTESTLRGKVYCKDVSICDRRFHYPVEHIVGRIDFTEKSVALNNLSGGHGDVKVTFNGFSKDFGPNWQYEIKVTSNNMALDNDLYNALSTKRKKFWSAFSPSGLAAIDYRISRHSQTDKKRTLAVELLDAEAIYRRFPYPLKNLTGKLLFDRDSITFSDVVSQFNGRKITINGRVTAHDTDRPICEFGIKAENVPLDSTLSASLSDRQRYLYNRLNMAGLADAEIKVLTSKDGPGPADVTANISLRRTSLKLDDFPLAISDVSAKTVITRDLIHIQNLTGSCGESAVSLTGRIWPGTEAEKLGYHLALHARQAQLDDDLLGLLPESLKEVISELQPEGKINYRADLNKAAGTDHHDYRITVDCLGNSFNFEPFPYPLKDITGSLTITTESIRPQSISAAESVRAAPDTTTVKITGRMAQTDGDLGDSRFDLDLEKIRIFNADDGEKYIDFVGVARFKGCNLNTWPAITELDAVLKTKGLYKIGSRFCDGQAILLADGLKIKGKSLTSLRADISYDNRRRSWLTKNLIADCYGGRLTGRFEFKQPTDRALEYLLQIGFDNIDLKQFLSDAIQSSKFNGRASGKMCGSLSVGAVVGDNYSRLGRCRLQITDMQVAKLSPMAKLLYVLKLTEPKDFAFDRMFVDSCIKHNRLFFEQLDLSGQGLAFNGSGWMDLQSQDVDLILFARGPRLATAEPSILQSLTEGLGGAVVRMEVTGNFYDPQVTTKTLPVIEDTLGILGTKPTTSD